MTILKQSQRSLITTFPANSTKSYNSVINRYSSDGSHNEVVNTFFSMLKSHTPPDAHTYPNLFKACTFTNRYWLGISSHQRVIVDGYSSDSFISSSLINFYVKFGCVDSAQKVFDKMPLRNVVPWTSMIGCYSRVGDVYRAFYLYNLMRYEGFLPSCVTVLSLICGVGEIYQLECLHASAICFGFDNDLHLVNCMLSLYGKFGRVEASRKLFESVACRDVVSWNSLVSGYAQTGNVGQSLLLLKRMRSEGINPDQQTLGAVLNSFACSHSDFDVGKLIHAQIVTSGLNLDAHIATSLVVLYSRYGEVESAFKIFEKVVEKDVVLWTSMVSGFVQNDEARKAMVVFSRMLDSGVTPSSATIATLLSACAKTSSHLLGTSVHGYLLRQGIQVDIPVQNSLVTMYAKCGLLRQSSAIFNNMSERDVVSWNAIVAAHAQNGDLWKALCLLNEMRSMMEKPDTITIVSLLQACASTGALQQGRWIHNFVVKSFSQQSIMVGTALVDMYSKCGDMEMAHECFHQMPQHDVVSWSTIIAGYGSHGKGEMALNMFSSFLQTGIQANSIIFLSALFSCSHNGLVSEGLNLFKSMTEEFGIKPELEHRACVVDLLCRAGRLREAYNFVKTMFSNPTVEILGIILDACREKGDEELGEIVGKDIMMLNPVYAENYVQLAHSFASMNRWEGVGDAWAQMKALGLRKIPGWSYIEQNGKVTTFFKGQSAQPHHEEMIWILKVLGSQMLDLGSNSNNGGEKCIFDDICIC